jgi:hypothetical protein
METENQILDLSDSRPVFDNWHKKSFARCNYLPI